MRVHTIDHIVLNTSDVERSLTWYVDLLGLAPVRVDEWRAGAVPFPSVRIDDHFIIDLLSAPRSGDNLNHFCLVVDRSDVDGVATDTRFTVVAGPVIRFGAKGDGCSVYVVDPDGNVVELRSYE